MQDSMQANAYAAKEKTARKRKARHIIVNNLLTLRNGSSHRAARSNAAQWGRYIPTKPY